MARLNQPRSIDAEANLAERIRLEREARGLSYEALAKLMTEAWCPINASAIFKIEKGEPRRKIGVDELVGFSRAFDTSVEDLLTPVELLRKERAKRVVEDVEAACTKMADAAAALVDAYTAYFDLAAYDPDLREYAQHHLFPAVESDEKGDASFLSVEVDGKPVEVDDSRIRESFMDFQAAIIEMASEVECAVIDENKRRADR